MQDGALGLESFNDGKAGFDVRLEPFADDLNLVIGSSRVLGSLEQASNSVRQYDNLLARKFGKMYGKRGCEGSRATR